MLFSRNSQGVTAPHEAEEVAQRSIKDPLKRSSFGLPLHLSRQNLPGIPEGLQMYTLVVNEISKTRSGELNQVRINMEKISKNWCKSQMTLIACKAEAEDIISSANLFELDHAVFQQVPGQ